MTGVAVFLGTPSAPWHVLQTSNLAPRMAAASAAFPGVGTKGSSTACSTEFAGAPSAARATRTPKTVGKQLPIMFILPIFECPHGSVKRPTFQRHLKDAAVGPVAQDGAGFVFGARPGGRNRAVRSR